MEKLTEEQIEKIREEERSMAEGFQRIGEFMFWYSQLEFTIKVRFSNELLIPDGLFDAVTVAYDFAALCRATQAVLTYKFPDVAAEIAETFKRCLALNDGRVRIAHGMWTHGVTGLTARHSTRNKPEPKYYFDEQEALPKLTQEARDLMTTMFNLPKRETGSVEMTGIEVMHPDDPRVPLVSLPKRLAELEKRMAAMESKTGASLPPPDPKA